MDWDSHRYLECFFAVPMMGAVLHTVNVRISPEQVLYTINHAADDVILVNAEFLPLVEAIRDKIRPGVKLVLINDAPAAPQTDLQFDAEYEAMLADAPATYTFPDLTRTRVPRRSTRRVPPACLRGSTTATVSWCCIRLQLRKPSATRRTRRSRRATCTCR